MSIDVTQAQTAGDYRAWLASRLPADHQDVVDGLLWHLREVWDALHPDDPDEDADIGSAISALLDAEAELGVLLGLIIDGYAAGTP